MNGQPLPLALLFSNYRGPEEKRWGREAEGMLAKGLVQGWTALLGMSKRAASAAKPAPRVTRDRLLEGRVHEVWFFVYIKLNLFTQ